jgi:hypothetical protein
MKTTIATLALCIATAVQAAAAAPVGDTAGGTRATDVGTAETVGTGTDKVVCKREPVSGSRTMAKKVCQTAAEWERQRRADQQAVEKIQSSRWKS